MRALLASLLLLLALLAPCRALDPALLQPIADAAPASNALITRMYLAHLVLPRVAPRRPPTYPPLDSVQAALLPSKHNARTPVYHPPYHAAPPGHPHPPKPHAVEFPPPSELELRTLMEQLRPGSIARSEVHKHENTVEGGEFLVEGGRVWLGKKAWVVGKWDVGKRWNEDEWNLGMVKEDVPTEDGEPERGCEAVGHGHILVLRMLTAAERDDALEFVLVAAHGPLGEPRPPPDVSEHAGTVRAAAERAVVAVRELIAKEAANGGEAGRGKAEERVKDEL